MFGVIRAFWCGFDRRLGDRVRCRYRIVVIVIRIVFLYQQFGSRLLIRCHCMHSQPLYTLTLSLSHTNSSNEIPKYTFKCDHFWQKVFFVSDIILIVFSKIRDIFVLICLCLGTNDKVIAFYQTISSRSNFG